MKVIGIDPAPGKKSTICQISKSGQIEFNQLSAGELHDFLDSPAKDTLICWDAPLTMGDSSNISAEGVFTRRKIEKVFASGDLKAPKGISVLGYCGCPHWTISQFLLGYPKIYPADNSSRDFKLIHSCEDMKDRKKGPYLAEVHPAVALWFWYVDYYKIVDDNALNLKYKNIKKSESKIELLINLCNAKFGADLPANTTDDQLDAWVAWKLGDLLIKDHENQTKTVDFLGSEKEGSFMLPCTAKLSEYQKKLHNILNNNS